MNITKIVLIGLGLLALSACKEKYNGTLNVYSPMAVNKSNLGAVTINKGSYPAQLKINSKKKATLEVNYASGSLKVPLVVNVDLNSLAPGQKVRLLPEVTGQPFVAEASYDRQYTHSEEVSAIESCTYNTEEYRCWIERIEGECKEFDGRRYCEHPREHRQCGSVTVTHQGSHDVRYYYSNVDQYLKLDIIKNGALVATLSGANSDSNKIYNYKGTCY